MANIQVSKYQLIINWIKQQMSLGNLSVGDQIPSETELCKMFSVSRQTIRQAVSLMSADGLLYSIRGSGTYIKSTWSMPKNEGKIIGVVTPYVNDYIFPNIVNGIHSVLTKNKFNMMLSITNNQFQDEQAALQNLLDTHVNGLIIEPTKSGLPCFNQKIYKQIQIQKIPCILINSSLAGFDFPCVRMDDYMCGQLAVSYLLKNGHRKIGGLFKSDAMQIHYRYQGFLEGFRENNLPIPEKNIVWVSTEDLPFLSDEAYGDYLTKRMESVSAVVCYNDQIAVRFIDHLKRIGKSVPEDISIISFDNSSLAKYGELELSSFSHPKEEMGIVAASIIIDMLSNKPTQKEYVFKPVLSEGNSVKRQLP